MARKAPKFPTQSNHAALNAAVAAAEHLTVDQRPVVALGRSLAKRVDKLEASGFVIDGRFDNVSAGMYLKVLDALGLTVKVRAGRVMTPVPREEPLVPPAAEPPVSEEKPSAKVTGMAAFREGRAAG